MFRRPRGVNRPARQWSGGRPSPLSAKSTDRVARWLFLVPVLSYVLIFFVYPLAYNVWMSVTHYTINSFYTGETPFSGLENYTEIVTDPLFTRALVNTVLFTLGSIAFQFAIGLGLALLFQHHFPLNRLFRTLLLLPWLLPVVVGGTVFRWIFDQDYGVLNQILLQLHLVSQPIPWLTSPAWALSAVILANIWAGIPFNLVLLYSGRKEVPDILYEAASVDGARAWQQFRYVTWPMLRPVAAVALMLGVIYTIKVFDIIMVLTNGGPANGTQTLATWAYFLSFSNLSFGQGAAVGNILIALTLLFAVFYLRSMRNSLEEER